MKGQHWPKDLDTWDYDSPAFQARLVRLVEKLGEAWNDDPRIFCVQMGLIGWWGEDHHPHSTEAQRVMLSKAFARAFPDKPVVVRHPHKTYMSAGFGIYYDTFAYPKREEGWSRWIEDNAQGQWRLAPMEGEVEYNWQKNDKDTAFFGVTPNLTMTVPAFRRYMTGKIRQYHANHLGWIADYSGDDPEVLAGAGVLQKAFGYRLVLKEFSYPSRVEAGGDLSVEFQVVNTGSAPMYLDWPVAVALLDAVTHEPVWQTILEDARPREWMPGSDWDNERNVYQQPPEINTVHGSVSLPRDIKKGNYEIALALLDRQGGLRPSARFAIRNYYRGGYHPFGKIGVGVASGDTLLDPASFDSPAFDDSIRYVVSARLLATKTPAVPEVNERTAWQTSPDEMIDPLRYWDITDRGVLSEKRVTFDGPGGSKVISMVCTETGTTVYNRYGSSYNLHYGLDGQTFRKGSRYRFSFKAKSTPGYAVVFRLLQDWQPINHSTPVSLTETWQSHSIDISLDHDCSAPMLEFSFPLDRTGEFSVTDYHLKEVMPVAP
jgi:hypothetical protein